MADTQNTVTDVAVVLEYRASFDYGKVTLQGDWTPVTDEDSALDAIRTLFAGFGRSFEVEADAAEFGMWLVELPAGFVNELAETGWVERTARGTSSVEYQLTAEWV